MKKIIVLAAIVLTAVMSHGASVYWTCTNVYAGNDVDKVSGVAYFLTTDMLAYSDAQDLKGKGAEAIKSALGSAYHYTATDGTFSKASTAPVSNADLGLADATSYTAYLMVFNANSVDDATAFYLTDTKALTTMGGTSTSQVKFGSQSTNSKVATNWTSTSGIPEPTSGLLLLVGGAMLALRRKQK